MDPSDRALAIVVNAAARAYAFPRPYEEPWDEQLCAHCQRTRPDEGHRLCASCEQEASR
jgi:hypothetical protein